MRRPFRQPSQPERRSSMAVRTSVPVPQFAREILAESRTEGNKLFLPTQLTQSVYKKVNRVIEAMGGKWSRREQAHLFPGDPAEIIAAAVASGRTPTTDGKILEAYYATPELLATRIVTGEHSGIADLEAGTGVLEPSAGEGALVRAILHANPDVHVTAVEPNPERAATIGSDPRVSVVVSSFEQFAATAPRPFAAVVMNPPFALSGQPTVWMDHLYTAWDLLIPGGQLLAIAPGGYTWRPQHKYRAMRDFIATHGGYEELPARAFATSGTEVDSVFLHARRPTDL
ncbi:class I SAM-dependent methyltransferase [Nocardia sp. alder85J]|uniref:class I SAM-dependent methyltransferase n=1 Tax=Nocardia sp. alder85J TaxID=2862949 RepID=UPI001CD5F00F|nr:class I SAM-dependent methyltransferase [Nocardia sp. alder85J]MCX4094490.1 class I SAM-dependent methyltransferase [Nocardia sp. alder85J]